MSYYGSFYPSLFQKYYVGFKCLYRQTRSVLYALIPTKFWLRYMWYKKFHKPLNIKEPKTYNEKLQYLKVYGDSELARLCSDKYAVRSYIKEKIGTKYLNELITVYDDAQAFDFASLPNQCVIKATHDSGSVLVIEDKRQFDEVAYKQLQSIFCNMHINYAHRTKEWVYAKLKPRIIVERYMDGGKEGLYDYKLFCFGSEVKMIQVDMDRFGEHKRNFYTPEWERIDLEIEYPSSELNPPKPKQLDEMLKLTEILARPFVHVRVDWYIFRDQLIFGEMTFFHGSGWERFNSHEWALKMGSWIDLDYQPAPYTATSDLEPFAKEEHRQIFQTPPSKEEQPHKGADIKEHEVWHERIEDAKVE